MTAGNAKALGATKPNWGGNKLLGGTSYYDYKHVLACPLENVILPSLRFMLSSTSGIVATPVNGHATCILPGSTFESPH